MNILDIILTSHLSFLLIVFDRPNGELCVLSIVNFSIFVRAIFRYMLRLLWHPRKSCILDVFSFMISSVLFFSDLHFFYLHTAFKLMSEIVQCCPTTIRNNLMVSKLCCFYGVLSVHALGHSLCQ